MGEENFEKTKKNENELKFFKKWKKALMVLVVISILISFLKGGFWRLTEKHVETYIVPSNQRFFSDL